MNRSTIVKKNDEGLNELIEALSNFCEGNFLTSIQVHNLQEEDIINLASDIKIYHAILEKEYDALEHFAKSFVKNFATENNECFSTAARLFGKIRRSIGKIKQLLCQFTPTDRRCATDTVATASVLTHSNLIQPAYTSDMFGLSQYPQVVPNLFQAMKDFILLFLKCLKLCRRVLNDERTTRHSVPLSKQAYCFTYDSIILKHRDFEELLEPSVIPLPTDEITKRKLAAKTEGEFYCNNYHIPTYKEFVRHALVDYYSRGKENGLTPTEVALWGNEPDVIHNIRLVISNLDSLEPADGHKKISSIVIVALIAKFSPRQMKRFVLEYLPTQYKGNRKMVTYHAVSSAKSDFEGGGKREEVLAIFDKMDKIIRNSTNKSTVSLQKFS